MLLPFFALVWIAGLASVGAWSSPWWTAGATFLAITPAVYWLRGARGAGLAAAGGVLAVVSSVLMTVEADGAATDSPLLRYIDRDVMLIGRVASEPDPGLRTARFRVDVLAIEAEAAEGRFGAVLVTAGQYTDWLPGDVVRLEGQPELPTDDLEGFDYRAYLLSRGIVETMAFPETSVVERGGFSLERASAILQLRFERALQRSLPEPEASLAAGIAIGRDDGLPPGVVEEFRASGLAHLTAVSGSNVAILAALIFVVATPVVGRQWAILPAAMVLAFYLLAAGLAPTVVRSTIMAWTFLAGAAMGRPQGGLAALGLAAIVMTAIDPGLARDVGFQLSLASTAGLIVLAPWIESGLTRALMKARVAGFVGRVPVQAFSYTTAATLATLPIVATTFGRVSVAGLWANVVAEPVFLLAFPLSVITGLAGWVHPDLGWAMGIVTYYPLKFVLEVASVAASMPGASASTNSVSSGWAMLLFGAYAAIGWLLYRRFAPEAPWTPPSRLDTTLRWGIASLGSGAVAAWVGFSTFGPLGGPGVLEVVVLDVGQGDATLVRTPGGRSVLVDGGPSDIRLARELGAVLPHWDRRIDLVILSHADEDHVAGLAGLHRRFLVGQSVSNGIAGGGEAAGLFRQRAGEVLLIEAGEVFFVDGVRFEVLWPPVAATPVNRNDGSMVIRVVYGDTSVLLTGDIESRAQDGLLESGVLLRADILKVPHHGAATSQGAFFAAVGAEVAVISAGQGNRYGHPADETIDTLAGTVLYRTDEDGRIRFRSNGETWTVATQR
ncbi:MAG: DNA internalization-related competence protein ComEC/Rec2 [Dehalococcoidia bacterium]